MHIVRFAQRDTGRARVGVLVDGQVRPLEGVDRFSDLLSMTVEQVKDRTQHAGEGRPLADVLLLPPIDGHTEVWASGVTYERSMDARVEESASQDVYTRVYGAARPELFFKSPAWRVVTNDEPVAIRHDSKVHVPEPELALVVNSAGEVLGYTICNDMSSRDIEGENPLYISQAKTYAGSCALAPGVRPAWEVADPMGLTIQLSVHRDGAVVFSEETSTARMHRTFDDLVEHLVRAIDFPHGAVLSTGTGIVPSMGFTLLPGDRVDIDIDQVGSMTNPVGTVQDSLGWPWRALENPLVRLEVR